MIQRITQLTAVSAILALSACGGGGSGDATQSLAAASPEAGSPVPVTSENLEGSWTGNCLASDDGTSNSDGVTFSGGEFISVGGFHADSDCSYLVFDLKWVGDFAVGQTNITSGGSYATELDLHGEEFFLRSMDQDFTDAINREKLCGQSDWELGVAQSTKGCEGLSGNLIFHDIVELFSDDMYVGLQTDSQHGRTDAARPNTVDYSLRYSRIFNDGASTTAVLAGEDSRGTDEATLGLYMDKLFERYGRSAD